jgi:hypothetical protein
MVKPIILPDGFANIGHVTQPEFMPDQATMARFDADPYELQRACDQWLRIVFKPPKGLEEPYLEFDQLTQALMLWSSRCGLGDGWQLIDVATATYQHKPIGEAVWRAQGFIELIMNHSQMPTPTAAADGGQRPTGVPKLVDVREAAKILDISERTLATLTAKGDVPCIRIGHSVKYSVDTLWEIVNRGEC